MMDRGHWRGRLNASLPTCHLGNKVRSAPFLQSRCGNEAAKLGSGRPWGAKLFTNRSGRVAYPLDCAPQLVFGHAEMPRPIFNVIILLDNDFAAVGTDFTDHCFVARHSDRQQGRVAFVPERRLR
jgi:hypothetical protein